MGSFVVKDVPLFRRELLDHLDVMVLSDQSSFLEDVDVLLELLIGGEPERRRKKDAPIVGFSFPPSLHQRKKSSTYFSTSANN